MIESDSRTCHLDCICHESRHVCTYNSNSIPSPEAKTLLSARDILGKGDLQGIHGTLPGAKPSTRRTWEGYGNEADGEIYAG